MDFRQPIPTGLHSSLIDIHQQQLLQIFPLQRLAGRPSVGPSGNQHAARISLHDAGDVNERFVIQEFIAGACLPTVI